jgi:hypothetical protein
MMLWTTKYSAVLREGGRVRPRQNQLDRGGPGTARRTGRSNFRACFRGQSVVILSDY